VLSVNDEQLDAEDLPTASDINSLIAPPDSTKTQTKSAADDLYELIADPQAELSLKVFCFFEDLHVLQGEIRKAWSSFEAGKLSLVAATIVTTAAIQLVDQADRDLIGNYPRNFNASRSYQDLALMIFYSACFQHDIDADAYMDSNADLIITPFQEFMYLPVGRTLMRISQQHSLFDRFRWPAPIMPMRYLYLEVPELLDMPHMERFQKEDEMICQLILDYVLLGGWRDLGGEHYTHRSPSELLTNRLPAFDDIFSDAMRPVWKEGRVTMRSVFAARVMLDIHEICLNFDGKTLLYDQGHRQNEYFEFFIDDQGALDMRSGLRWLPKDMGLVKEIYHRINLQMLTPAISHLKEAHLIRSDSARISFVSGDDMKDMEPVTPDRIVRSAPVSATLQPLALDDRTDCDEETRREFDETVKRLNIGPVQPHRDTHLYMNKNPLCCGTILLSQIVSAETAGIALANLHQFIFAVAHLYNALHKMNLTKVAWSNLDRIIELQRGPLFADDIHSTPEEMQARVWYRLGVERTGTRFIANRRTSTKKDLVPSPASRLLLQFFRSKQPLETTMYQLQVKMEQKQLAEKR
jgi:hypothetical protein